MSETLSLNKLVLLLRLPPPKIDPETAVGTLDRDGEIGEGEWSELELLLLVGVIACKACRGGEPCAEKSPDCCCCC